MDAAPYITAGQITARDPVTGVDTTGLPAARYSGVFVGLMNLVAAFMAKGIMATSHPAMYCGSYSYNLGPR